MRCGFEWFFELGVDLWRFGNVEKAFIGLNWVVREFSCVYRQLCP